jgi:hypothetical protein
MPVPGQAALHTGVAVKGWVPLAATVGASGLNVTEVSVIGTLTVITVLAPTVVAPRVALTKMPPVTAVEPAVNVTEAPVPVIDPRVALETVHAYVMVPGHEPPVHVGVAVNGCVPLAVTVGASGLTATEVRVMTETVITVEASLVLAASVALT